MLPRREVRRLTKLPCLPISCLSVCLSACQYCVCEERRGCKSGTFLSYTGCVTGLGLHKPNIINWRTVIGIWALITVVERGLDGGRKMFWTDKIVYAEVKEEWGERHRRNLGKIQVQGLLDACTTTLGGAQTSFERSDEHCSYMIAEKSMASCRRGVALPIRIYRNRRLHIQISGSSSFLHLVSCQIRYLSDVPNKRKNWQTLNMTLGCWPRKNLVWESDLLSHSRWGETEEAQGVKDSNGIQRAGWRFAPQWFSCERYRFGLPLEGYSNGAPSPWE